MLRKVDFENKNPTETTMGKADFPQPFYSGLEYNPPVRGTWNIVHTGMLIPESRQIFACARGCLRGVILTAAEMNAMDRMSWISVEENDFIDGGLESNIIDGVTEILNECEKLPPCVLLFVSCVHLFAGIDFEMILQELSEKFPQVDFVDCYMTPTMRKNISPDAKMRIQLYKPLKKVKPDPKSVNIIGCDFTTDADSELIKILSENGYKIKDITLCKTYEEYLQMGESVLNISFIPTAKESGEQLSKRLSAKHLYLPLCYGYAETEENYKKLFDALNIPQKDFSKEKAMCEKALENTFEIIGKTQIAIDYTACPRPLGLARLLAEHGFNVTRIYCDVFNGEEKKDFDFLRENYPDIKICSTLNAKMRFYHCDENEKILCIGQKAAYFCGSDYFVNIVSGGGYYGFKGIEKLCGLMTEAFRTPKDRKTVISRKGLGCESCI